MNEFKKLGLSEITLNALKKKGFEKPSPIQEKVIPILLEGKLDIIGQAQTGTGKTACFALPILENLKKTNNIQAIILTPTRELAVQVATEIKSLKGERVARITAIYGGASIRDQMDELHRGVDIVVGTPGRVMDLMNRRKLDISEVSYVVLDEADEMLNMGFVEDIEDILSKTNKDKKMLLFSATMPREIQRIAKKFMRKHELIKVKNESLATELIEQVYFNIESKDRYAAIRKIVVVTPEFHGIIFCKTKAEVDNLSSKLIADNYKSAALHGDISQGQRESILKQFKDKKLNILIATDVAARGIDVNDLNIVINYSLPQSPEIYVHRIGRTGRAGNKGKAITFLIPSERRKINAVEKVINQRIKKGTLPTAEEIIKVKKDQIEKTILKIIEGNKRTEYDEITEKLLEQNDAKTVVSSILCYAFSNELDMNIYKEKISTGRDSEPRERGNFGRRDRGRDRNSDRGNRKGRDSGRSRDSGRGNFKSRDNRDSSRRGSRSGDDRNSSSRPRSNSSSNRENRNGRDDRKDNRERPKTFAERRNGPPRR